MATTGGPQQDIVTRLCGLPTAAISDAMDRAGIEGAVGGLAPLSNDFRAVGPAFTVRYAPIDGAGPAPSSAPTPTAWSLSPPPGPGGSPRPPSASRPPSWRPPARAAPCAQPARPSGTTSCRRGSHDGDGSPGRE